MQHFVRGLVIAFIISVLLIPTLLFAQGDLTLEGLAEQITSLTERITKLEAIHTTVTVDGYCKLPVDDQPFGSRSRVKMGSTDWRRNSYFVQGGS